MSDMINHCRAISVITRRELKSYFHSPYGFVILALFTIMVGVTFSMRLSVFVQSSLSPLSVGKPQASSLMNGVLQPFFSTLHGVFLFLVPFVTMRLFSEEKRGHTLEMLLTAPIGSADVVLGKFLSAFAYCGLMIAVAFVLPGTLYFYASPDPGPILGGALGVLLLVGCLVVVGMCISLLSESQLIVGLASLIANGALYALWIFSESGESAFKDILKYLSLVAHVGQMSNGIVYLYDVVFYFSVMIMGIAVSYELLESHRWK